MVNNDALKFYNKALDSIEKNDLERAMEYIMQAYKKSPDSLEILETISVLNNITGDYDEAEKYYNILIEKFPEYIYPYLNYINLLANQDKMDEAYDILEKAETLLYKNISENPSNFDLYLVGSNVYYQLDLIDEAIMLLYRGLKQFPQKTEFYREIAIIYYEIGVYDETLKITRAGIKLTKKDATLELYLGLSLQKMNYLTEALKHLKKSYKIDKDQPELKTLVEKIEEIIHTKGKTIEEIIKDSKAKKRYKGIVKWFDEEKGIGAVKSEELKEELFLHYSSIQMDGFQTVKENMPVELTYKKTDKGYIVTKLWPVEHKDIKRFSGKVISFDIKTGIGTIMSDEIGEVYFHYSGLIEQVVKIITPDTFVEFSTFNLDGYTQAFNIKKIEKEINKKNILNSKKEFKGSIKWYDKKVGYGIIETSEGIEVIIQKANIPSKIDDLTKKDLIFNIEEIESIAGEKIPKAINIKINKKQ